MSDAVRRRVRRRIEHPAEAAPVLVVVSDAPTDAAPFTVEHACVMPHGEPVERYLGLLCGRHYNQIANRLAQILELYAMLPDAVLPGVGGTDGRAGKRIHSPAPGRLEAMVVTDRRAGRAYTPSDQADPDAAEDIFDVMAVLISWVYRVRVERAMGPEPRQLGPACRSNPCSHVSCALARGYVSLTGLSRTLTRNRHWIAAQPWVVDFLDGLELVHRELARASGAGMWPVSIGACPNCQAKLYNTPRVAEVTCRRCGTSWSGLALVRLRLIHEQERA